MKHLFVITFFLALLTINIFGQNHSVNLETQIDSLFQAKMKEFNVPGAIFAMVSKDSILMTRGYGIANLKTQTKVDPQHTAFRVASISKGVSATLIMKMIQEGHIQLDEDINHYLKTFKIEKKYDQPITFRHLLTHTSGFDTEGPGRRTLDPNSLEPMTQYFAKHMTKRVASPGKILMYSNHAGSLAGAVLEDLIGKPFDQLIKDNLLDPLEMNNSGFDIETLPARELARGYFFRSGEYVPSPFEYTRTKAGSMFMTTANDMANFLKMHLNGGQFKGKTYLNSETAKLMHEVQFRAYEKMEGVTMGLYEMRANNKLILTHSGGFDGFMGQLYILPEEGIAFFMTFNQRNGGAQVNREVRQFIFDHYIPFDSNYVYQPEPTVSIPFKPYLGTYWGTGMAQKNIGKVEMFPGRNQWKITKGKGDTIIAFGYPYVPIDKHLFRLATSDNSYLKFVEDQKGKVHLATFGGFFTTHRKLKWYELRSFHTLLFSFCLLIFLMTLLTGLLKIIKKNKVKNLANKQFNWVSYTALGCFIFFIILVALVPKPNRYGVPPAFEMALYLPIIGAIACLPLPYLMIKSWLSDKIGSWGKIRTGLTTLALFLFVWMLWHWQILGFNY